MPFFKKNQFFILSAAFILALLAGCLVKTDNDKLATPEAPDKIQSLQLAWSAQGAHDIVASWAERGLVPTALRSIVLDYVFIVAYTLLFMCCVLARNTGEAISRTTRWFLMFCLIAGLADVVENLFLTPYIARQSVTPFLFFVPASIKWGLIAVIVIYILLFLRHHWTLLRELLPALWVYLAGVIFVLIGYFLFIKVPAGRDVVIQIGEYSGPFWWTLFSVILWTTVTWYSARVVGYQKIKRRHDASPVVIALHQHFPRLMAFNATVCIQAAIWALPTVARLDQCQLWAFVIGQNLFYFAWSTPDSKFKIQDSKSKRRIVILAVALVVYAGVVLVMAVPPFMKQGFAHQYRLPFVALLLFVLELGLLWLFTYRRARLQEAVPTDSKRVTVTVASQQINTPVWLPDEEKAVFRWFNVLSAIGVVIYILGFIFLGLANRMGPLAIALLAFGILVGVSNIITVFSIHKRVNFFFLLFALAVIIGMFANPYQVRTHAFDAGVVRPKRPDLQTYFHRWITAREHLIRDSTATATATPEFQKTKPFPVYVVIADGGASRSGYWVSSVLSALQDESIRRNPHDTFADHVLCLAGASGGSVGTATFYALLRNAPQGDSAYLHRSRAFLQEDFLSPVITHWLGSDFIQHFIPLRKLGIGDRAQALEESMEYFSDTLRGAFTKPFTHVIDTTGRLPMLFINTTHVQQGAPAVVSSVDLDPSFSRRIDVLDSLDAHKDLNYSTAVVLGARFPYVSPAGAIGNNYFVDGGYFDNTGAGIVHEMVQTLDSVCRKSADSALYKKLSINLIYLSNSSLEPTEAAGIHPLVNDASAPLLTVLGTYSSQTSVNNQRLVSFIKKLNPKNQTLTVNLYTKGDTVDYPMNWVISDYNLQRMNERLEKAMKEGECNAILRNLVQSKNQTP